MEYAKISITLPFKVWIAFQHFLLCAFSVVDGIEFVWWDFCQHHFLLDSFILFFTSAFLIYVTKSTYLFSGCVSRVSPVAAAPAFPQSAIFLINFLFEFNFQHYHFLFLCCNFIIVDQISLLSIYFCNMSHEFFAGR